MTDISFNKTTHYILPLLDDNIIINDISTNKGFINAFTYDINKPNLVDKIFLMYDLSKLPLSLNRKLSTLETMYYKYTELINDIAYIIFAFIIPPDKKRDVKVIKSGILRLLSPTGKVTITSFWSQNTVTSLKILSNIMYNKDIGEVEDIIPEPDYAMTDEEWFQEKCRAA